MKNLFPDYALECLAKIEAAGYEAWFVGGSVRDSIIGKDFYDVDITTNALPEEIESIFEKTVPTGKKHGTITVLIDKNPIEVTTYRSEFGYSDNRHPNEIKFEKDISADLSRRDFTINAIAYNPKKDILDIFGGTDDIKGQIIRTVGNPNERFSEDALRILRAYRFASQLGYDIEENTKNAAISLSEALHSLSGERILSEIKKLAEGKNPYIIEDLLDTDNLSRFGIGRLNIKPCFSDIKNEFKAPLFISLCEHDISLIKEKLKAEKKLINQLMVLSVFTKLQVPNNKTELKLLYNQFNDHIDLYLNYIKLRHPENYGIISRLTDEILTNKEPYLIKHLCIGGDELLNWGIKASDIGSTLKKLTLTVIKNPFNNTPDKLKNEVKKLN